MDQLDEPLVSEATLVMLERLADKTPYVWVAIVQDRRFSGADDVIMVGEDEYMFVSRETGPAAAEYLEFIAAARMYQPRLIAEIRRLRDGKVPGGGTFPADWAV
jgi:hypothetical protein